MAMTPTESAQYTSAQSQDRVQGIYGETPLQFMYGKFTSTAAGAGTVTMFTLPAGRILLHLDLCRVYAEQGVSTADLDIGHGAYTNQDGTAVAADVDEWVASADVGAGIIDVTFTGTAGVKATVLVDELNSKEGIPLTMTVDTANWDDDDYCEVLVYYSKG